MTRLRHYRLCMIFLHCSQYSSMCWNQEYFTGDEFFTYTGFRLIIPFFKIVGKGHKGWSKNVDKELGNYDYLLGVDVGQ